MIRFSIKEKWINENGLEQRLIVSYSQKYANYQKHVREEQIQRAKNIIENPGVANRNLNDPKRFINEAAITEDGEIAEKKVKSLNIEAIKKKNNLMVFMQFVQLLKMTLLKYYKSK